MGPITINNCTLKTRQKVRGCLQIMSAKNGGVQTLPPPLVSQKSEISLGNTPREKAPFFWTSSKSGLHPPSPVILDIAR